MLASVKWIEEEEKVGVNQNQALPRETVVEWLQPSELVQIRTGALLVSSLLASNVLENVLDLRTLRLLLLDAAVRRDRAQKPDG